MKCGNFELTSVTCKLPYVGRTSRIVKQRYQEDTLFIKQNDPQSAYAVYIYILYNNHAYEPITIMSLLKQVTKSEFYNNFNYNSNFISIHTVIIKSSYRNKMKAKTTQCTN